MTLDAGIARPAIMDPANVDALAENLGGLAVAPRRVAPPPSKRLLDQLRSRNITVPTPAGRTWWYDTLANNDMASFLPSIFDKSTEIWNPYSINYQEKTKKWQILTAANARAAYLSSLNFLQGLSVDLIDFLSEYLGNEALKLVQLNRYFRDTCYNDLKSLHICQHPNCHLICDLGVFKSFRGLTSLRVDPLDSYSRTFTDLSALEYFPSLTSLDLATAEHKSWELTDLSALLPIPGLVRVRLHGFIRQMDISAIGSYCSLISLDLRPARRVTDTAALMSCSSLSSLALGAWPDTHLGALAACAASLTSLDLGGGDNYGYYDIPYPRVTTIILADLGVLRSCAALTSLRLQHCAALTDLSPLRSCTALTLLDLNHATTLLDLSPLRSCTALKLLDLNHATTLTDLSALESCAALTSVDLRECWSLTALPERLGDCAALTTLCLEGCRSVTDLSSLRSCAALTSLNLKEGPRVTDLSSLQYCNALRRLNLACSGDPDLNSLQHCVSLTTLDCRNCNMISVSALENCTALRHLNLRDCDEMDSDGLQSILVLASLPSLTWLSVSRFLPDWGVEEELYRLLKSNGDHVSDQPEWESLW